MKRLVSLILCVCLTGSVAAYAATGEQTTTIPVTLTIVHTTRNIDVTMPASLPVSVVDGKVLTADNVAIRNNSKTVDVEVAAVEVNDGAYVIADYDAFPEKADKAIAMQLNGIGTKGPGALGINKTAFPDVPAGESLDIVYKAKVSDGKDVSGVEAAHVVFVLRGLNAEV